MGFAALSTSLVARAAVVPANRTASSSNTTGRRRLRTSSPQPRIMTPKAPRTMERLRRRLFSRPSTTTPVAAR